jgi:glycerol transport system ATP-binding protein
VVVMTQGAIVQSGTAQELFERPAHTFVGHFIGSPGMNFLPCSVADGRARVDGHTFRVDTHVSGAAKLGVRPEFIECFTSETSDAAPVTLQSIQHLGTHTLLSARLSAHALWIKAAANFRASGERAWIRFAPERTSVYVDERRVG